MEEREDTKPGEKEKVIPPKVIRPQIGLALSAEKAGLENVDKQKVNKIVYEISKDSKYYKNEQKKSARVESSIKGMLSKLQRIEKEDNSQYEKIMNEKIAMLEARRDLTQTFFHVDMDAFYASVEIRDNPELKGKPVAVGGSWMLSTASYEARKYGVRSAMPGFIARQLCPSLIIVPTNFDKYRAASEQTRRIFAMFDPNYRSLSLDEASLHVTPYLEQHKDTNALELAKLIRKLVFKETQLTCSIGIAPNRRLAKICSDMNKPDGEYLLPHTREAVLKFMHDLPVRKISGIGKVTERMLEALDVKTCGQMYEKRVVISRLFKPDSAEFFLATSLGISNSAADQNIKKSSRKSISKERTFNANDDMGFFLNKCKDLSESLAKSMEKKSLAAKNLTLKLKTHTFEIRSRSISLPRHISTAEEIYSTTVKLLQKEMPLRLRLIGIRLCKFNNLATGADENENDGQSDENTTQQPTINRFFSTRHQRTTEATTEEGFEEAEREREELEEKDEDVHKEDDMDVDDGDEVSVKAGHKRSRSNPTTEKEKEGPPLKQQKTAPTIKASVTPPPPKKKAGGPAPTRSKSTGSSPQKRRKGKKDIGPLPPSQTLLTAFFAPKNV